MSHHDTRQRSRHRLVFSGFCCLLRLSLLVGLCNVLCAVIMSLKIIHISDVSFSRKRFAFDIIPEARIEKRSSMEEADPVLKAS